MAKMTCHGLNWNVVVENSCCNEPHRIHGTNELIICFLLTWWGKRAFDSFDFCYCWVACVVRDLHLSWIELARRRLDCSMCKCQVS